MPAFRSVVAVLLRELGDFSLHPQGRPCGRPPAVLRAGSDTTVTGVPASPSSPSRTITAGSCQPQPFTLCGPAAPAAQPPSSSSTTRASPRWLGFTLKLVGRCGEPPGLDHLQAMRQDSVH